MFREIMVPLDGSELAERALQPAERLALATGATLHLVRVVQPLPLSMVGLPMAVPPHVDDIVERELQQASEYLGTTRARMEESGVRARAERLEGDSAGSLLDYERAVGIDLAVMCSHGRGGLARFALGSVADRLARHGAAPVLLVRAWGEPAALGHAVVPLDGSALAEEALRIVDDLARFVVHEVTLLRVIGAAEEGPEAERYLADAAARFQREHLACGRRVVQGDPAGAIIDAAGADKLVVMATHGRGGLTRWTLGSVADRVVHGDPAGVLLIRSSGR